MIEGLLAGVATLVAGSLAYAVVVVGSPRMCSAVRTPLTTRLRRVGPRLIYVFEVASVTTVAIVLWKFVPFIPE